MLRRFSATLPALVLAATACNRSHAPEHGVTPLAPVDRAPEPAVAASGADEPPATAPSGSVAWLTEFTLANPYGTRVRAGRGRVLVAHPSASDSDLGGFAEVDKGRLAVAAFDPSGRRSWVSTLDDTQALEIEAFELAPDGSAWVFSRPKATSEPELDRSSVLARFDARGKSTVLRRERGEHHSHAIAFGPQGSTAVAYVESAREQEGKSALTPSKAVVALLDSKSSELARFELRAEAVDLAYDAAGTLHVLAQLEEAKTTIAGQSFDGPGTIRVEVDPKGKPRTVVRLARWYAAHAAGTLFHVDRARLENGQALGAARVVRAALSEQEMWRTHVCDPRCVPESLRTNARGESVFFASSSAPLDAPFSAAPQPPASVEAPWVWRIVKLDERGAVRFAALGTCAGGADLAPDGAVAVIGMDCAGELGLADRAHPPKARRSYVALLRP